MCKKPEINELIEFAMSDSLWISREKRAEIDEYFDKSLVELLDQIRADCDDPIEAWTESNSFSAAAAKVEPGLRAKYPNLSDKSIGLLLNHAAFSWR